METAGVGDVVRVSGEFLYVTGRGTLVVVSPSQEFQATPRQEIPGSGEWIDITYRELGSYHPSHRIKVVQ